MNREQWIQKRRQYAEGETAAKDKEAAQSCPFAAADRAAVPQGWTPGAGAMSLRLLSQHVARRHA